MDIIHTRTLDELKMRYIERSIESVKEDSRMWTPLKWQEFRNRPIRKRGVVTDVGVRVAVAKAYLVSFCMLPDKQYWVSNVQDYKKFLALDDTDKSMYVREIYDCDDFAWRLMGKFNHPLYGAFAHGIALSMSHAFNCFVDWDKTLYLIEPQTDRIMKAPVEDDMYTVRLVIM